jgi:hypothetical protein
LHEQHFKNVACYELLKNFDRKEEAVEKTKEVGEGLKKGPQPPYEEFFYLPWE